MYTTVSPSEVNFRHTPERGGYSLNGEYAVNLSYYSLLDWYSACSQQFPRQAVHIRLSEIPINLNGDRVVKDPQPAQVLDIKTTPATEFNLFLHYAVGDTHKTYVVSEAVKNCMAYCEDDDCVDYMVISPINNEAFTNTGYTPFIAECPERLALY